MIRGAFSLAMKGLTKPKNIPGFIWRRAHQGYFCPPIVWLNSRLNLGTNVFERDWDLLVILDSCRTDAIKQVADEYDYLKKDNINEIWSVGSHSAEWMANTFDRKYQEELRKTAYISSNSYSYYVLEQQLGSGPNSSVRGVNESRINMLAEWGDLDIVSADDIGKYVATWGYHNQHDAIFPSPRSVTNHAILTDRNEDFDRILLHYMPPHAPYIGRALIQEKGPYNYEFDREPYDYELSKGECFSSHPEKLYQLYLDNLRWGLDELELLLDNVNRDRVVITADHGDPLGNHGILRCVPGSPHPKTKKVPWVTTTAVDSHTYGPSSAGEFAGPDAEERKHIVEENLKALGYRS